jgi:hypothetical protein
VNEYICDLLTIDNSIAKTIEGAMAKHIVSAQIRCSGQ